MAADIRQLPELPPPGPSQLEIRFRRLLHQCTARALQQHAGDAPGAAAPWQTDPKFHCYIESLRELLYDLESSPSDAPGPDVLVAYKQHVAWFGRELRPADVPAFCRRMGPADRAPQQGAVGSSVGPSGSGGSSPTRQQQSAAASAANRWDAADAGSPDGSPPRGGGGAGGGRQLLEARNGGGGGGASGGGPQFSVSAAAKDRVQTQQRLQDELAEDVLGLTAEMKAGALAMQNAIRYRGKLLEETESALVDSTANAQSAATKAKERYRAGRSSFCWTLMMLLTVALVFAGMVVYIKLTAMVGITGRRAPPPRYPQARPQW